MNYGATIHICVLERTGKGENIYTITHTCTHALHIHAKATNIFHSLQHNGK